MWWLKNAILASQGEEETIKTEVEWRLVLGLCIFHDDDGRDLKCMYYIYLVYNSRVYTSVLLKRLLSTLLIDGVLKFKSHHYTTSPVII